MLIHLSIFYIGATSRLVVGALLLLASLSKALRFSWFVRALVEFQIVPRRFSPFAALTIFLAESVTGVLLIWGRLERLAAYSAVALFGCFIAAIAVNLARGRFDIECGCLTFWKKSKIGWHLLFRNIGFAGLALLSTLPDDRGIAVIPTGFFLVFLALSVLPLFFSS